MIVGPNFEVNPSPCFRLVNHDVGVAYPIANMTLLASHTWDMTIITLGHFDSPNLNKYSNKKTA